MNSCSVLKNRNQLYKLQLSELGDYNNIPSPPPPPRASRVESNEEVYMMSKNNNTNSNSFEEENDFENRMTLKSRNKSLNGLNINNKIDTANLIQKGNGIISYQVPDNVKYGETYIFRLRITSNQNIELEELVFGNRNIPLSDNLENGKVIVEDIMISEYMSAHLWADPDGFEVYELSTTKQKINDQTYTEWSWRIIPINSGKYVVKMFINLNDGDFIVYERKMEIEISFIDKIIDIISKNYNWLWSAIVVPFIIPFIIKISKRKE
jgi:hypothetical protein